MAALGVVPASRVAMDTSSLLIAFGPPLTFKAPAPKLIITNEFNWKIQETDVSDLCANNAGAGYSININTYTEQELSTFSIM